MILASDVLPDWLQVKDDKCVITIHVQPGAKRPGVVGPHGDALKIRIDSPPVDGRANLALISYLADRLDIPRNQIALVSGDTARRKRLAISGVSSETIRQRMTPDA